MGVTSEVGLTTDQVLSVKTWSRKQRLLYLRDTRSHEIRATIQHIVAYKTQAYPYGWKKEILLWSKKTSQKERPPVTTNL